MYNAIEVSNAFNQQNGKKSWKAVPTSRKTDDGAEFVLFNHNGMVSLLLNCTDGRFQVKFNKFQGAWGDYINAISRGLFVVLTTLQSGGLPFYAPASPDGATIECVNGGNNTVFVRFALGAQLQFPDRGSVAGIESRLPLTLKNKFPI